MIVWAKSRRTFESSALRLLLEWASTSLESSVNQPTLPHALVVLNSTNTSIDEQEWDITTATENLMKLYKDTVHEVPEFKKRANSWREKGKQVDTMRDLILCYYGDIHVVRIPVKGRYMQMDTQITELHHEIKRNCAFSYSAKREAHMLSNTDELNSYLQAGFDHFTTKVDEPFNFVDVAFRNNPIPKDFEHHILGLAVKVRDVAGIDHGEEFFSELSSMVASYIFIDFIRKHRPGKYYPSSVGRLF